MHDDESLMNATMLFKKRIVKISLALAPLIVSWAVTALILDGLLPLDFSHDRIGEPLDAQGELTHRHLEIQTWIGLPLWLAFYWIIRNFFGRLTSCSPMPANPGASETQPTN